MFIRRLFSLGDPRWGRGNADKPESNDDQPPAEPKRPMQQNQPNQPPDLDEVWRNFNKKLSGLFGGKGGGNSGPRDPFSRPPAGGGGNPISIPPKAWIALPVGLALLWLASGFYIVQEGQAGAVLRFGKYQYATGPGFNWRLPSPIEAHEVVDLSQLRQTTVGFRPERSGQSRDSLMLTRDENMIDMQFAVQYRVSNPEQYLFQNVRPDDIVQQGAETAMREVVGRSLSDAVLYENKEAIGREVLSITQRIADRYQSGITIVNVTIQNVQPPEEVQAAFNDAIRAAQDAERLKNEGQAYANDVIPRARGAADRLREEAQGYRERVVAQAEGDASRFSQVVTEYSKAPAVTRERMYLETMQQVFTSVSKVLVDSKAGSNLLYLPLDKLMAQTSEQAQAAATGAASSGSPTSAPGAASGSAPSAGAPDTGRPSPANSLRDRFREAR